MTSFSIQQGLPYVSVTVSYRGRVLKLDDILLDTGSVTTIFRTDALKPLGIAPGRVDKIRFMVGIGDGYEAVLERQIDGLSVGDLSISPFTIQMGLLNYQIDMNGILGSDFLSASGANIDFTRLQITPSRTK